ncbi:hypothetical protein GQR58_024744 [Nymphon striatum]|nr:hypothetical protein GQR58_024744 [Nymphon striatum]
MHYSTNFLKSIQKSLSPGVLNRIDSLYLSRTTEHQKHRRRGGKPTLTCLFWNVHGRNSACNKLAFDNFLDRSSVTFLSETMLINPSSVLPNDYFSPSASKCTKQGRPSSGIEFNVNPNLCAIVISKAFHHINIISGTLHIIGVYYKPSTEFDDLHTDLHKALSSCSTPYIVIGGDFNLHYKDTELKDLLKLLDSFHITLCSNPDVHTFFSKKSSCVDYIFTSHSLPDTSVDILNRSESEHLPLKATIKMDRHDFLHFLYRNSGLHPIRRLPKPGTSAEALNNSNNVAESVVPEASGANSDKVICYCQKLYDASQGRVICCNNPKRSYLRRIQKDTENRNLAITTAIKTATKNSKHKVCPDIFNQSVGCLSQVQQDRLKIAIKQSPFVGISVDESTDISQKKHIAIIVQHETIVCDLCQKICRSKSGLKRHKTAKHKDIRDATGIEEQEEQHCDITIRVFARLVEKARVKIADNRVFQKIGIPEIVSRSVLDVEVVSAYNAMLSDSELTIDNNVGKDLLDSIIQLYVRVRSFSFTKDIIQKHQMKLKQLKAKALPDQLDKARLLAAASPKSGSWLEVLPVPNLGTRLDDEAFRIGIGLRIGAALYYANHTSAAAVQR